MSFVYLNLLAFEALTNISGGVGQELLHSSLRVWKIDPNLDGREIGALTGDQEELDLRPAPQEVLRCAFPRVGDSLWVLWRCRQCQKILAIVCPSFCELDGGAIHLADGRLPPPNEVVAEEEAPTEDP